MKKVRTCLALLLTASICLGLVLSGSAATITGATFSDVPTTHWAYAYVERAFADGVVNGKSYNPYTGARTYDPKAQVSQIEFLAILTRAFYPGDVSAWTGSKGNWYDPELNAADAHKLRVGVSGGVTIPCDRCNMAQIMYNLMLDKGAAMPNPAQLAAAQNAISDWSAVPAQYREAVRAVYAMGLITGKDASGTFGGASAMNRAEAAVVYTRLFNRVVSYQNVTVTPVSGSLSTTAADGFANLFDFDTNTKWCANFSNGTYAVWSLSQKVSIIGYNVATGGDNSIYPNRNPAAWRLYGANGPTAPNVNSDGWVLLDTVSNDATLKDVNRAKYAFSLKNPVPEYQHYKLVVDRTQGSTSVQLSEFTLAFNGTYGADGISAGLYVPSTPPVAGSDLGSRKVQDGSVFEMTVDDRLTLENPLQPGSSQYAFRWQITRGADLVEVNRDGCTCGFHALKSGVVEGVACLDTVVGSRPYSYEYHFTINILERPVTGREAEVPVDPYTPVFG